MYIIAGLGNPGNQYAHTRHNVGFRALDALYEAQRVAWHLSAWLDQKHFTALIADGRAQREKIILIKPHTYMNNSGDSIGPLLRYHRAPAHHLLVLHDDVDIPFGQIRIQFNRSAAGHNGVQSIIDALHTQQFWRVRIGIGKDKRKPTDAYVLSPFSLLEKITLRGILHQLPQQLHDQFFSGNPT